MSTIKDDPFFQEGQEAAREGADIKDCPYPEGTDGENGWMIGFRTCPKCGQDHHLAIQCIGSKGGKHPKGAEAMRAMAAKRWADWRHARALAIQKQEGIGEYRRKRKNRKAKPEALKTWRW